MLRYVDRTNPLIVACEGTLLSRMSSGKTTALVALLPSFTRDAIVTPSSHDGVKTVSTTGHSLPCVEGISV